MAADAGPAPAARLLLLTAAGAEIAWLGFLVWLAWQA
jgi:hypothetical protein